MTDKAMLAAAHEATTLHPLYTNPVAPQWQALEQQRDKLLEALNDSNGILEAFKSQSKTADQQLQINSALIAEVEASK